jgi:Carboxypeptidase regulatory-like domain
MLTMEVERTKTDVRSGPCGRGQDQPMRPFAQSGSAQPGVHVNDVVEADGNVRYVSRAGVSQITAVGPPPGMLLVSDPSMTWLPAHSHGVHGVVTDEDGNPVAGALVELQNDSSKQIVPYVTNEGGAYRFDGLTLATSYGIWATVQGKHAGVGRLFSTSVAPRELTINFKF